MLELLVVDKEAPVEEAEQHSHKAGWDSFVAAETPVEIGLDAVRSSITMNFKIA